MLTSFNIRVYGLLVQQGQVLVSYEQFRGLDLVKFPGGGVEFGESPLACLQREFYEELNIRSFSATQLFHIPEQVIASRFRASDQIIPIYYLVWLRQMHNFTHTEHRLRWHALAGDKLSQPAFTFAQDQVVFDLLCEQFANNGLGQ